MGPGFFNKLGEAYARCELIFDETGSPADFRLVEANPVFQAALAAGDTAGSRLSAVIPADDDFFEHCRRVATTGVDDTFELSLPGQQYRVIAFSEHPNEFSAFYVNLTPLYQAVRSANKYRQLFLRTHNIILFIGENGRVLEANPAALAAYGYTAAEIAALNIQDLRHNSTLPEFSQQFGQALNVGIFFETLHRRKDGSVFPVEVSSIACVIDGQKVAMSIIRDISDRKELERELTYLAHYDSLTGISNRNHILTSFESLCTRANEQGQRLALLYFDIDKFKRINDTYGHESGDVALREVATRVSSVVSGLLGRIGGDEFVILQPFASLEGDIRPLVRAICAEFERPIETPQGSICVSTSIGVSVYPDDSRDMDTLIKYADNAMYEAKGRLGSSCCFYSELSE